MADLLPREPVCEAVFEIIPLTGLTPDATVTILDMNGREIHTQLSKHSATQSLSIDVSGLTSGAYFVRVVNANGTVVRKLIVR